MRVCIAHLTAVEIDGATPWTQRCLTLIWSAIYYDVAVPLADVYDFQAANRREGFKWL
jgi:hypothetical protein